MVVFGVWSWHLVCGGGISEWLHLVCGRDIWCVVCGGGIYEWLHLVYGRGSWCVVVVVFLSGDI